MFTPVEEMAWVKPVALEELKEVGRLLIFGEEEGKRKDNGKGREPLTFIPTLATTPTIPALSPSQSRTPPSTSIPSTPASFTPSSVTSPIFTPVLGEVTTFPPSPTDSSPLTPLRKALAWASARVNKVEGEEVVLAGSLYLVADFYRIVQELREGAHA